MTTTSLPEQSELHRDRMWRRDEELRVESVVDAERFIDDVGFVNELTLKDPTARIKVINRKALRITLIMI